MRRVRAALDRSALFQQGLPEVGNHIRDQLRLLVLWCEQHEIDEALNHHRCQVTQGSAPAFDAVLDKLIDLAVQAVGHHASSLQCTLSHSPMWPKADDRTSASAPLAYYVSSDGQGADLLETRSGMSCLIE